MELSAQNPLGLRVPASDARHLLASRKSHPEPKDQACEGKARARKGWFARPFVNCDRLPAEGAFAGCALSPSPP